MMKQHKGFLISCIAAMIAITGCGEEGSPIDNASGNETTAHFTSDQVDERLVHANNRFGITLYHELLETEKTDSNIMISPSSIAIALAMTYNGADTETKKEMETVLHVNGMSLQDINAGNEVLKDVLEHIDPAVEVNIANSLWLKKGKSFHETFLNDIQRYYDAEMNEVDFTKEKTADRINDWVSDATNEKIEQIVGKPMDPTTAMLLLNAIYFKGEWAVPFEENATKEHAFTTATGQHINVPMMYREGEFMYKQTDDYQAVQLPYGSGEYRMNVYLPATDSDLAAFTDNLASRPNELSKGFRQAEGSLRLPRFTSKYEIMLNDTLKAIGMKAAFDDGNANFSRMAPIPPNLSISTVRHKTFIEVNEQGTEAAAVTSVEITESSAPVKVERFEMEVNRPFFLTIEERRTGAVLFMGSITNPQMEA